MSNIVYVNGDYLPATEASVSVFDRGFLFADAVYEVTAVLGGKLIDFDGHTIRLARSLAELDIEQSITKEQLLAAHRELIKRNNLENGGIYLQVSRGTAADRNFYYPDSATTRPTVVMFAQANPAIAAEEAQPIKVISIDDIRWGRCDIKTVQLLYPCMGKMMARAAGADDAWMVKDGCVTEGTNNNAYIVKDGKIITRALSSEILHGITRAALLRYAGEAQMTIEERNFTIAEAQAADEAFLTSATALVTPVIEIDRASIGSGQPGPVARRLRRIYRQESLKAAI